MRADQVPLAELEEESGPQKANGESYAYVDGVASVLEQLNFEHKNDDKEDEDIQYSIVS